MFQEHCESWVIEIYFNENYVFPGLNLTGEYLGQTKKKIKEKLNCARGGVLFIDDAYELGKGMAGVEAMTLLVSKFSVLSFNLIQKNLSPFLIRF